MFHPIRGRSNVAARSPLRALPAASGSYNTGMERHSIRFHGTYRYPSQAALEQALGAAKLQLEEEDFSDPTLASLHWLLRRGAVLTIDVVLPAAADVRFAAATLFETLAEGAVEGAVDALHGRDRIDSFPSGGDD